MPNPVKYNTSSESLALRSGNFYLGTGDVPKGGPTLAYWAGVDPPGATAYTIYLNKSENGPSIYQVGGGADLQSLTNRIAGTSHTTDAPCIDYFMSQSDKMIVNRNFGPIVTNGLQFAVDRRSTLSWNGISGATVYDMQGGGTNSQPYQWTNSYVQSWADSPSSLTICCLIRRRATPTTFIQYPISKLGTIIGSNFNLASFGLRAVWDGSNSSLTWVGPGTSSYTALGQENFATFGSVVDQTSWVGLQYSSSTGQAWFNGNKVGGTGGTALATNTGNLSLLRIPGTSTTGAVSYEIIQALFYNRELTDAEMYQNYQASIAPPVGSFYGGGIVFATQPSGTTGATGTAYIVANEDSGNKIAWQTAVSMNSPSRALTTIYGSLVGSNGEFYSKDNTDAIKAAYGSDNAYGIDWALDLNTGGYSDWSMANFGAAVAITNNVWKPNLRVGSIFNEVNFPAGTIIQISNKAITSSPIAQLQSITPGLNSPPAGGTISSANIETKVWAVRSQTYSVTDVT